MIVYVYLIQSVNSNVLNFYLYVEFSDWRIISYHGKRTWAVHVPVSSVVQQQTTRKS